MSRVTGLPALTAQLTRSRFAARQGESLLYLASIVAYVVCSALALTVAGGTWMFYNRWKSPQGIIAEAIAQDPTFAQVTFFYLILALIACALLLPTLAALAAGAAVLGARGRERRLAALRLMGLSSGDVTRMALLDTVVQATIGTVLGALIYLVTLPAWTGLDMLGMHVAVSEMLLPWWLGLTVASAVVALGLLAAALGLRNVRITPLGVARRTARPRLKSWRLWAFVAVLVMAAIALPMLQLGGQIVGYLALISVMLMVVAGLDVAAPWMLQQLSRLFAQSPSPSVMWAARRIQANPKTTWRRVGGVGLLALIGGYVGLMPLALSPQSEGATRTIAEAAQWDFTKGVMITLAVGLILTSTSILISQASAVFERAEQTVSLRKVGAGSRFISRVGWIETLGPLVLALLLGAALGMGMAYPMYRMAAGFGFDSSGNLWLIVAVLAAGVALAALALAACEPLQRRVGAAEVRRND